MRPGTSASNPGLASASRFSETSLLPVVRLWAWQGDDGDPYRSGFATAVFIRSDGLLVTNAHVVDGSRRVHVFLENGASFPVQVLGVDPLTDLALLKVSPPLPVRGNRSEVTPLPSFPVIRWGDSGRMLPGEPVYAVGHPFGLHRSVSLGIVSALPEPPAELAGLSTWIQTDASINPGNSGGPLLNANGEMIGLASAILTRSGGSHGVGFAVPSHDVRRIAEELLSHGHVKRGWLGISGQKLNPDLSRHFLPAEEQRPPLALVNGVLVADVHPLSPARGRLRVGDVLLQLDGRTITGPAWLRTRIQEADPGSKLLFQGYRGKQPFRASIVAAEFPPVGGGATVLPGPRAGRIGKDAAGHPLFMAPADGLVLGQGTSSGSVKITRLKPGSPGFLAGLMPGDRILKINEQKPASPADAMAKLRSAGDAPIILWVERPQRGRIYVAIKSE